MNRELLCPACGSHRTGYALPYVTRARDEDAIFNGLTLWSCSDCHIHFANPCPEPSILSKYYAATYRMDGRNTAEVTGFPADNLWFLSRGVSVAHLLRSVLAEKTPQRIRVLDIGAGYGHVLYALRALLESQIEATAVEPDSRCLPTLARVADSILDRDMMGELSPGLFHDRFDLMLMLHIIEHIADPYAFLQQAKKFLAPDGLMMLEVPNCPQARIRWYNQQTPHVPHLIFFTVDGLKSMLRRLGLDLLLIDAFGPVLDSAGSYDASFARFPADPKENIELGIAPPVPYPIFEESGPGRLFLRAIARLDPKGVDLHAFKADHDSFSSR